jgi:hypothetical protein
MALLQEPRTGEIDRNRVWALPGCLYLIIVVVVKYGSCCYYYRDYAPPSLPLLQLLLPGLVLKIFYYPDRGAVKNILVRSAATSSCVAGGRRQRRLKVQFNVKV